MMEVIFASYPATWIDDDRVNEKNEVCIKKLEAIILRIKYIIKPNNQEAQTHIILFFIVFIFFLIIFTTHFIFYKINNKI